MHREHHEDRRYRVAWMIELNQARSKPDTVDRSVRTASTLVHNYNSAQYCKTETVFSIFPFLQTNITSKMWPSGYKGRIDRNKIDSLPEKIGYSIRSAQLLYLTINS